MAVSVKKYILLGVLISCLGLMLYAMPEQPVVDENVSVNLQLSDNIHH